MIRKGFQISFAIALVVLSVICTIWRNEVLDGIIYAVVIPSFVLSIISFVLEVADYCKNYAEKITSLSKENMELSDELYNRKIEEYKAGKLDAKYVEGYIPTELAEEHRTEKFKYATNIMASQDVKIFFLGCQKVCSIVAIVGYVLLIISLCLSYYAVKILSAIDLNCITLWSMALLYFTMELKTEMCNWVFELLYRKYTKKNKKVLEKKVEGICAEIEASTIEQ